MKTFLTAIGYGTLIGIGVGAFFSGLLFWLKEGSFWITRFFCS